MSSGGRKPKGRGTSFEYRIRNFLRDNGWESERNPLSGASAQVSEVVGKHDVRASREGLFLQIECKKTAEHEKHILQRIWIEKIDFANDEFLVFAFGRSANYTLVPEVVYQSVNSDYVSGLARYAAKGKTRFTFHRSWIEEEDPVVFMWEDYGELYVVTELSKWIQLLLKRGPLKALKPTDVINSATEIGPLIKWYKENQHRLTNLERCHLYGKLHRLENGIDDEVAPEFKAAVQWWRDTSDDVVMKCPHCGKLITYRQLEEHRAKNKESE